MFLNYLREMGDEGAIVEAGLEEVLGGVGDAGAGVIGDASADVATRATEQEAIRASERASVADLVGEEGGSSAVEGSASAPESRVAPTNNTNYNSGPPTTWAGASKGIIIATGVVGGGAVAAGYGIYNFEQGKQKAAEVWNGAKQLGKDLEHGVEQAFHNAEQAGDHLSRAAGQAAASVLGGPAKTVVEVGTAVVLGVGVLYVSYRGYMFLKG